MPTAVVKKARACQAKRFWVLTPPDTSTPLLYTQASFQVVKGDEIKLNDDIAPLTHTLVLVVPPTAAVRLSSTESICEIDNSDELHYMHEYLWEDLLWQTHDALTPHPSIAATYRNMQRIAYRPGLIKLIRNYIDACPVCLAKRKGKPTVGAGIVANQRFWFVMADHKVLDADIAEVTGIPAILVCMDMATGTVAYNEVPSMQSIWTASTFITEWIPHFGVPWAVLTDAARNLDSGTIHAIYKMLGIKATEHTAT